MRQVAEEDGHNQMEWIPCARSLVASRNAKEVDEDGIFVCVTRFAE